MCKIEIAQEHIKEAEIYLLGNDRYFETKERVPFIKNLETCDLLAVPGSGKTTALLAKLYCLEKHLPFEDGSGILVLSHTNAAVDEIKKQLQKLCPNLFEYPNFIGTIQNFVNHFLAIPFANSCLGYRLSKFDNDAYSSSIIKKYKYLQWTPAFEETRKYFYRRHIERSKSEKIDVNILIQKEVSRLLLSFSKNKIETEIGTTLINEISNKKPSAKYINISSIIKDTLSENIISYEFAYSLGFDYLHFNPSIKSILQSRFKFVFVDEMQDLDKHQIGIIDDIFVTENSKTIIQRIGDKNQAIYSSGKKVKVECEWKTRNELFITGSNRLTKEVAEIVDSLVLDRQPSDYKVNGLRILKEAIPPHLFLFNWDNKDKLIRKFKEIIKGYQDLGHIPQNPKDPSFKVIAWSGEWKEEDKAKAILEKKVRLEHICNYSKEKNSKKEDFDSLSKYLQLFDKERKTLESIRKSILNALIHILKLEGKKYPTTWQGKAIERYYSKSSFIEFIQKSEKNIYEQFKQDLYGWCIDIIHGKYKEVFDSMNNFIKTDLKEWFNISLSQDSKSFIGTFQKIEIPEKIKGDKEEIKIEVGTVHSAKGQTHCATLYIETSYYSYETEKIKAPLFKEEHKCIVGQKKAGKEVDVQKKQALKMMYVGFSRPTHLLCFAVLEENVKNDLEKFSGAGWEIVKV